MTQIEVKSRVGADGVLHLELPLGPQEANEEVVVTVRRSGNGSAASMTPDQWRRFVDETAGTMPWLERPPQGEYEQRER